MDAADHQPALPRIYFRPPERGRIGAVRADSLLLARSRSRASRRGYRPGGVDVVRSWPTHPRGRRRSAARARLVRHPLRLHDVDTRVMAERVAGERARARRTAAERQPHGTEATLKGSTSLRSQASANLDVHDRHTTRQPAAISRGRLSSFEVRTECVEVAHVVPVPGNDHTTGDCSPIPAGRPERRVNSPPRRAEVAPRTSAYSFLA